MTTAVEMRDIDPFSVILLSTEPVAPEGMEQTVNQPLASRVSHISTEGSVAYYKIDGCLNVRVPSQVFRDAQVARWQANKDMHQRDGWICVGITVLSGLGALATSGLVRPLSLGLPLPVRFVGALMLGPFAILTALMAKVAFSLASQASKNMHNCSLPRENIIAEHRAKAYQKGFLYAYFHRRLKLVNKQGVLHPQELKYLYGKYYQQFFETFLAKEPSDAREKEQWLLDFTSSISPMRLPMMYGLGAVPPALEPVLKEFSDLAAKITMVKVNAAFDVAWGPLKNQPTTDWNALYTSGRAIAEKALQAWDEFEKEQSKQLVDNKLMID